MRSLGTRRAALVAGLATVGIIALAGCSAGQVAETAMLNTPIAGVNADSADGGVFVRNAQVAYNGSKGYAKGENAPLELSLFNQTEKEITVLITSTVLEQPQVVSASKVGFVTEPVAAATTPPVTPSGSASASVSPSAPALPTTAPTPTVTEAQIKIAPFGSAQYRPTDAAKLQVIGLSDELKPGEMVNLVFKLSTGEPDMIVQAPVAIPIQPASRAPGLEGENTEHE